MKKVLLNSIYKEYTSLLNPHDNPELTSLKFDIDMPVALFEYENVYVNDLGRVYNPSGAVWDHEEFSTIYRYWREMRTFRALRERYRNLMPRVPPQNRYEKPFLLAYDIRIIGNYFHFIVDFLGRLMALGDYRAYTIILPEEILTKKYDYIQQVINSLTIDCYFIGKNSAIKLKKLFAVSPVINAPGNQRKDIIKSLRKFFLKDKNLAKSTLNKSIYISRKNAVRSIKNEESFIDILREFGVDIICPEDVNFSDMIQLMSDYNHLIGVDGAQLTNMLFMQEDSKVLSLKHIHGNDVLPSAWFGKYPNVVGNHYFYSMANNLRFGFYGLQCEGDRSANQWNNQNLIIPKDIKRHLELFLTD